jgi:hypothetical protein
MKALFYGGAIAGLAGLFMGMGMALPEGPAPGGADAQPISQMAAPDASAESTAYGPALDSLPPAYVINSAYSPGPVYDLRPEAGASPAADAVLDPPAIDQVLNASWTDAPEPVATPQDVAAAGDTSQAEPTPRIAARTYASIDALLAATAGGARPGPS